MIRSSSVPRNKTYSVDSNELPQIERKSFFSSSKISKYNNKKISNDYDNENLLMNKDVSNVINNINTNLNQKLKESNKMAKEQMDSIKNNYYEIKYLLDERINKIEKNQKKVLDFMKYSLDKDKLKNDMEKAKYNNYIKNNEQKKKFRKRIYIKYVKRSTHNDSK